MKSKYFVIGGAALFIVALTVFSIVMVKNAQAAESKIESGAAKSCGCGASGCSATSGSCGCGASSGGSCGCAASGSCGCSVGSDSGCGCGAK